LYFVTQRLYYGSLYVVERIVLGPRLQAWVWKYLRRSTEQELERSIDHPRRGWLLHAVQQLGRVESALEVGCNSGANLIVLANAMPHVTAHGVDISPQALDVGKRAVAARGLQDRITYQTSSAMELDRFRTDGFDVTFADAVLMYVGPEQIDCVLRHMWRIARHGIVVSEWSLEPDDDRMHMWYDLHWVHNYHRLLRQIDPSATIDATRIPAHIIAGAGWVDFGTTFVMKAH
jgi:SAM-dependent methyltransferase